MKIKRYKKVQRYIGFFEKNFSFRQPYQILVDGTFANAALINKVNIREQLPKYLSASVKIVTTPCVLIETEKLGAVVGGALQILRRFPVHKCTHKEEPVAASKCLRSMVHPSQSSRYVIATQDVRLREKLRDIPGVAILYLHGNAPTLEAPSEKNQTVASQKSLRKVEVLDYQREILNKIKEEGNLSGIQPPSKKMGTKKRQRAGPNPLSCKKSKKRSLATPSSKVKTNNEKEKRKRKRPKIKIPEHVKEELSKMKN